eukprot:scaffold38343_cov63-Phaeocystis_antarctica.AAC.3
MMSPVTMSRHLSGLRRRSSAAGSPSETGTNGASASSSSLRGGGATENPALEAESRFETMSRACTGFTPASRSEFIEHWPRTSSEAKPASSTCCVQFSRPMERRKETTSASPALLELARRGAPLRPHIALKQLVIVCGPQGVERRVEAVVDEAVCVLLEAERGQEGFNLCMPGGRHHGGARGRRRACGTRVREGAAGAKRANAAIEIRPT